jgi:hypothetical protein
MGFQKSNLIKKTIGDKHFITNIEQFNMVKIITSEEYKTNGEYVILVKDTPACKVVLNNSTTEHIIVKALTKVLIKPLINKIDEEFDEILINRGACVEFYQIQGNWYILSSDGLKVS